MRLIKFFIFCSLSFLTSSQAQTIVWDKNKEPDLAGYRVYYGSASREYQRVFSTRDTSAFLGYPFNITYAAVTAYDESGNESYYSEEVSYTSPQQDTLSVIDYPTGKDFRIVIVYESKGPGLPNIQVQWQKYNPDKTIYSTWIDMPAQGDTTWNWMVNATGDTLTFNGSQITSERFNPGLYFLQQYRVKINDNNWLATDLMRLVQSWVPIDVFILR